MTRPVFLAALLMLLAAPAARADDAAPPGEAPAKATSAAAPKDAGQKAETPAKVEDPDKGAAPKPAAGGKAAGGAKPAEASMPATAGAAKAEGPAPVEEVRGEAGEKAEAPEAEAEAAPRGPTLRLEDLDLLPLGEFEARDLQEAHPRVARRLQGMAYQIQRHEEALARRENADDAEGKRLRAEIAKLREAAAPQLVEATALLREHGLTDAMLETMAAAPEGPDRLERYAHRLVLLLELDGRERALFARVLTEMDGAYLAIRALEDRTRLALKQTAVEERNARTVLDGFRRQTREIDRRFWRLVDYALDVDQKAALWEMLPARARRHSSAVDHVYALPGLTPSQGARVRALTTEIEAESAPDQALVRRLQQRLREKDLPREERDALAKERSEAYRRLNDLRRLARDATLEILTPEQVHALKAVPPQVSINERRRDARRVLEGLELDEAQTAAIEELRKEGREAARAYRERVAAIRKEAGDVGPDSPQTMMMEMMMAGARGEATTAQRHLLGRVFLEVLEPEQVSGWVMGLYGYRR